MQQQSTPGCGNDPGVTGVAGGVIRASPKKPSSVKALPQLGRETLSDLAIFLTKVGDTVRNKRLESGLLEGMA
jgi:hypothetical protein